MPKEKAKYGVYDATVVVSIAIITIILCANNSDNRDSYFAGLEALFTGLAFSLLITSLALQAKELTLQRQALEDQVDQLRSLTQKQEDNSALQERNAKVETTNTFLTKFTWPTPGAWKMAYQKDRRLEQILNSDDPAGQGTYNMAGGWYMQAAALLEREYLERDLLFALTRFHTQDFVDLLELHQGKDIERPEWQPVRDSLYRQIYEPFRAFVAANQIANTQ